MCDVGCMAHRPPARGGGSTPAQGCKSWKASLARSCILVGLFDWRLGPDTGRLLCPGSIIHVPTRGFPTMPPRPISHDPPPAIPPCLGLAGRSAHKTWKQALDILLRWAMSWVLPSVDLERFAHDTEGNRQITGRGPRCPPISLSPAREMGWQEWMGTRLLDWRSRYSFLCLSFGKYGMTERKLRRCARHAPRTRERDPAGR